MENTSITAHGLVGHLGRGAAPRELECLLAIAGGLTSKEAARELGIAAGTIDKRLMCLSSKLGVIRRAQLVAEAFRRGLIVATGSPFPAGPNHQNEAEQHGVLVA